MKAWRIERHGGPEVLRLLELPDPNPGPGEVRIRVEAVGLNHLDLWTRNGVPGHRFPLPVTPGGDIAGVIDAMGPGSESALSPSGMKSGSPVLLSPGISCGHCKACLGGFDPLCPEYKILGESRDGGCAEFVTVPIANLIARPKNLSATEGAALLLPYLTAWTMLVDKAQLRPGDTVLIQAGGSGVSVAAIQIAKLLGATVLTTVGSEAKVAKAKALGADYVIRYDQTPFREEVRKILSSLGKRGCEVVLDHVGQSTFAESLKCLAWGGKLVTCGATSGGQVEVDLKQVFFKNISILGSTMGSKASLLRVIELAAQGKIRPVVDSAFPLDRLADAFTKLEDRSVFGKIVLTAGKP